MIDQFNFNGMKAGGSTPITHNALIEVLGDTMTVTVGNGRTFLRRQMSGTFDAGFMTCVPFERLRDWSALLPGPFKFKPSEVRLQVRCGRNLANLITLDPDDYPDLTRHKMQLFTCSLPDFQEAIASTNFAVGVKIGRPALEAIYINDGKMVAMDGFRMALAEFAFEGDSHVLLVDPDALKAVSSLSGETLTVFISNSNVFFSTESEEVISVTTEDKYPDFLRVFPKEFVAEVTINAKTLHDTVKIAGYFDDSIHLVITDDNDILVWAVGNEVGDIHIHTEAQVTGKALEMYLNKTFLLQGLAALGDTDVVLKSAGVNDKLLMEAGQWRYLVMPLVAS